MSSHVNSASGKEAVVAGRTEERNRKRNSNRKKEVGGGRRGARLCAAVGKRAKESAQGEQTSAEMISLSFINLYHPLSSFIILCHPFFILCHPLSSFLYPLSCFFLSHPFLILFSSVLNAS